VRVTPQGDTINSFAIAAFSSVQTYPALVFNGTDYIAVWSDCQLGRYYINTTRITPAGTIPGSYYWVGAAGSQDEDSPDIADNGARCLCVWSEEYAGVKGRFINHLGSPEDTVFMVAPFTITSYTAPAIASDGNNFLIVWFERSASGDWDILGQLISAQGSPIGASITIATGANSQYDTDVLFDGVQYFVVWRETSNFIYGQRVDVNGSLLGPAIPVSNATSNYRYQPTLVNSRDNYLIVWSELQGDYFDVYGNIDVVPVGVSETIRPVAASGKHGIPTVISGPIARPSGKDIALYDILGRTVRHAFLETGIYYIACRGVITQKLIIVQ